jgi:hypothetical protein
VDADKNHRDMKQERDYVSKKNALTESLLASCTVPATSEARLPTIGGISLLSVSDESLIKVNVVKQRKNLKEESENNNSKENNIDQTDEALLREDYKKTALTLGKLLAITSAPSLVYTTTIWACEYSSHFQHLPPEFFHEPIPAIVAIPVIILVGGVSSYVVGKIVNNPVLSETLKLNQVYYLHGIVGFLITPLSGLCYISLPQAALMTSALIAVVPFIFPLLKPPPRRIGPLHLLFVLSVAVGNMVGFCSGGFGFFNGVYYCAHTLYVGDYVLYVLPRAKKRHYLEVASIVSVTAVIGYVGVGTCHLLA